MEHALDRPFVLDFDDRTRSKRPPREALAPATDAVSLLWRLVMAPVRDDRVAAHEVLPTLAFWGD